MIFNHLPISAYSGVTVLKFDMKMFVNVARLEIGQLFTQGTRRGHLCTLDTFLVSFILVVVFENIYEFYMHIFFFIFAVEQCLLSLKRNKNGPCITSSPKGNDRSPESNVPTSSHFKQAIK